MIKKLKKTKLAKEEAFEAGGTAGKHNTCVNIGRMEQVRVGGRTKVRKMGHTWIDRAKLGNNLKHAVWNLDLVCRIQDG